MKAEETGGGGRAAREVHLFSQETKEAGGEAWGSEEEEGWPIQRGHGSEGEKGDAVSRDHLRLILSKNIEGREAERKLADENNMKRFNATAGREGSSRFVGMVSSG